MVVGLTEILVVAAMWFGILVEQLTTDEQKQVNKLGEDVVHMFYRQGCCYEWHCTCNPKGSCGSQDSFTPLQPCFSCGPIGVEKIELTKALAKHYFGSVTIWYFCRIWSGL